MGDGNESWTSRRFVAKLLMKNERPFGLLSEAEQEVMRECEVECFQNDSVWRAVKASFGCSATYRVRADFQPKYAEEPKPQCGCLDNTQRLCVSKQPNPTKREAPYLCTLPLGHDGDHMACDHRVHCLAQWPQEKPSEWGEWQEYQSHPDDQPGIGRIRFKKGK